MAATSKLTVESLSKLGAKRLAELLIEEAGRNRQLKQAVHMALAAETGPSEAGHEVRKRLAQLARSETFVSSEKARELASELGRLKSTIIEIIGGGNPNSPPSCSGSCSIFMPPSSSASMTAAAVSVPCSDPPVRISDPS